MYAMFQEVRRNGQAIEQDRKEAHRATGQIESSSEASDQKGELPWGRKMDRKNIEQEEA